MACACRSCIQHSRTLGIANTPTSKYALHKAYRAAAKLWHPDRFEGDHSKRLEAEDRFKRIHAAYQALCEHFEKPAKRTREVEFVTPIEPNPRPAIHFGDAPGCFAAPNFPDYVRKAIEDAHLDNTELPIGFVDLSGGKTRGERYVLLGNHKMYIRDASGILSVIWYADLGEINLIDHHAEKPGAWRRITETIAGKAQTCSLQINRLDGSRFRVLTDRPDDRVKKVVYNFLRQMKSNSQS
ncbi:MAG: DnaJ domain-containing protein [Terracidiphilus sp.]